MVKNIMIPSSNISMNSTSRCINGNGIGGILLDGGLGGQSSYNGIDDYLQTTNRDNVKGNGLSDRINNKLQNLNINKPRRKNISLSM